MLDSPALREAYNANLPKLTQYWTELGQNQALFEKYKQLSASPEFESFSNARKRIVENALRDFRLSGAELPAEKKKRFAEIDEELSRLGAKFSENLLDATNAFSIAVDESRTAGIPQDDLKAAREAAEKDGQPGWKFTLHAPSLNAGHALRRRPRSCARRCTAPASRAPRSSARRNGTTRALIAQNRRAARGAGAAARLPELRRGLAGAEDGAVARPRCSPSSTTSRSAPARSPSATSQELRAFARAELGLDPLQSWDVGYASEKLRAKRYAFSDQEVKQYFPEDVVMAGLFRVVETLYGIRIAPGQAPAWHEDVRFFEIRDAGGSLVGQFYLDLYARETKRGGAWMDEREQPAAQGRERADAGRLPQLQLLAAPVGGKPALFTHDDVITLFHEFGHGLHHLLTRGRGPRRLRHQRRGMGRGRAAQPVHGEFLLGMGRAAAHDRATSTRGAPLPRALFDKMLAAKNFQSGLEMLRQIEFALFDMRLHSDFDAAAGRAALELLDEVRERVAVLMPPAYNRFPNSFSHIFAGGYAAGYYSYKWAEVLSADAYSLFEENEACSTPRPASDSATRSSPSAAAGRRRSRSAPSAAASRASKPCCGTMV